jgi:endo-1,4-beta-xylanase
VPKAGNVSLKLYDVTGKLVKTLVQGYTTVGSHTTGISAEKLASGIYLLKYESAGEHATQKLIVQ